MYIVTSPGSPRANKTYDIIISGNRELQLSDYEVKSTTKKLK